MTANPYTRGIAEFVSGLEYNAIPDEVRQRLKHIILDAFGCGIYGAGLEWSRILQAQLGKLDSTRACVVWGTGQTLSSPHAVLVNGTQVQGFELDDNHTAGMLHVSAVALPALISIAEMRPGMSGREFLTAALAGYEVGPRVGLCMGTEHLSQGWHTGATFGVFAAAVSAARGLKLDAGKTVHALGIAGTQACGLMAAQYGAMVKRMHAGRASQSGLYGALLAEAGFTGIVNVFESEYGGFCTTFSRSTDRFKINELTAGLGSVWQVLAIRLKFYSCVGITHATLDAIREMQGEHPFGPDDVARIVVYGSESSTHHMAWKYVPQGPASGQQNLGYCVATLLVEGEVFVDQFTEDRLTDPVRIALAEKVEMRHDPAVTAKGAQFREMVRVEVYLRDGTRMERTFRTSRDKENLPSEARIVKKFENLATRVLPRTQVEQLRDAVLDLEKLPDVSQLARLMTKI